MTQPGSGGEGRLALAVGLLSLALLGFELALMQVLALVQWHHFAYMVIAVALLGFGASGTTIALFRDRLLAAGDTLLPFLFLGCATTMAMAGGVVQNLAGGFDIWQLFRQPRQAGLLLCFQLMVFVPFFLGALPIGLAFSRYSNRIALLYAANLLGSGLGGGAAVGLMWFLHPEQLPALASLPALVAGCLLWPARPPRVWWLTLGAAVMVVGGLIAKPLPAVLSQYKDLSRTLALPEARVTVSRSGPGGLMQAVSSPVLRHAPGLSLTHGGEIPVRDALFNNGDWFGTVPLWPPAQAAGLLDATTGALAFSVAQPARVLVLNSGAGDDPSLALAHDARLVQLVEPNLNAVDLLNDSYPESGGALFKHPAIRLSRLEPRTWLAMDRASYDLITVPPVGAFGGTTGLFALKEENLLTREGFRELWAHLDPNGLLSLSAWLDFPARIPFRLTATIMEMLAEAGVKEPLNQVVAIRSWGMVAFLVKHSPFTGEEIQRVRDFCQTRRFDPLLLPDLRPEERNRFHVIEHVDFFANFDRLISGAGARSALYDEYEFNLRPATDNRPFFHQYLRWRSLPQLVKLHGQQTLPLLELGYPVVFLTLAQLAGLALVIILVPLGRLGWRGRDRHRIVIYFSGLGLGYMFVEMVFINQLVLYFGQPILATAAGLGAVLVLSGLGSYLSGRLPADWAVSQKACVLVGLLVALWTLVLPALVRETMNFSLGLKALFAVLFIGPPALAMGFPLPLGLRALAGRNHDLLGWAWGINGCVSVVAATLATITAVELGFSAVLLLAAAAYGLAAWASGGQGRFRRAKA